MNKCGCGKPATQRIVAMHVRNGKAVQVFVYRCSEHLTSSQTAMKAHNMTKVRRKIVDAANNA